MQTPALWPLLVYLVAVLVLTAGLLWVSHLLGTRHTARARNEPYESGIASTGNTRSRLSVRFYLVAALFLIFDVEVVFLLTWALAARELGWPGFIEIVVFSTVLLSALFYLGRSGALDWNRPLGRPRSGRGQRREVVDHTQAGVTGAGAGERPAPGPRATAHDRSVPS